ncbi:MAG TPA: hypothetical protein VN376_00545, partial [Longilinea sp.]|nr:hypothetical protein [Longilinea sp.]
MDQTVILWIALLLVAFGVAVWFIIRWSIVHTSKDKPQSTQSPLQDETEEIPTQAVLIVQAGGKLISVNSRARQLFHIPSSSEPNFERITRLIRPSDEFLRLCSQGGLGQLSIEGVSFNFSASPIPVTAPPWMVITINMDLDSAYPHHTDPNTLEHPLGLPIEDKLFSSLDLQYVVTSLLNRIERNFPTDFLQLFL